MTEEGTKQRLKNLEKGKATRFVAGEAQVEIARKGAIKSNEVQRKRRQVQEDAAIILSMTIKDGDVTDIASLKSLAKEHLVDANLSLQQLMILTLSKIVINKDVKPSDKVRAFEVIMRTSGQLVDKHEIEASVRTDDKKIERLIRKIEQNPDLKDDIFDV